jgi:hypothetical protein
MYELDVVLSCGQVKTTAPAQHMVGQVLVGLQLLLECGTANALTVTADTIEDLMLVVPLWQGMESIVQSYPSPTSPKGLISLVVAVAFSC